MKMTQDEKYMKAAIREAKKAYALDEVPIGCVIVQDGTIIARGYNKRVVVSLLRLFTVSVLKFKIRASPFESSPRTLPPQLTRSRHPHGTQELLLRAAPFLT